jgi:plastocyanin
MPGPRRATSTLTAAAVLLLVAACSSAAPQGSAGSASPAPSTSAAPSSGPATTASGTTGATTAPAPAPARTIEITVQGKQVTPAPSRVELRSGQTLRLVVTIDHDDELHAHGFDVERELTAGQPETIDLTGAPPGLYEVETHHPELSLLQVVVRP